MKQYEKETSEKEACRRVLNISIHVPKGDNGDYLVNNWTKGVNSKGRLTPGWEEQADLLEREGVTMKDAWHVDLKKHQWNV